MYSTSKILARIVPNLDRFTIKLLGCHQEPPATGLCRAYIPSFTFVRGICREFKYGGCGATRNISNLKEASVCVSVCNGKLLVTSLATGAQNILK